jgi:hypothetical protein
VLVQLGQGAVQDLAYTTLGQVEGSADLFQGKPFVEIKGRD